MWRAQAARRTQMTCGLSRRRWKKTFPADWEACGCPGADETAGLCLMLKCKSGAKRAARCDGCPGHAHVLTGISSVTVQEWGSVTFPTQGSHSAMMDWCSPLQIYCLHCVVPAFINMYNLLSFLGCVMSVHWVISDTLSCIVLLWCMSKKDVVLMLQMSSRVILSNTQAALMKLTGKCWCLSQASI